MSTLRLVPFGPPATSALQQAIAAAKGSDPLQPVTVAVPSNYAGLSLRRRLGASQGGLVNVGFIVFSRVAELLGSPAVGAKNPIRICRAHTLDRPYAWSRAQTIGPRAVVRQMHAGFANPMPRR